MKRLVLVDGNAILHRAYHAIPPLTAPDGSVVNAVYGFATMLVRLIGDLKPTHIAVAFDRPKPTFRKKLYEGYQAKRPKMDTELSDQIPKVHALIEAFGIPIFEKDGFEADDVIGTLATRSQDQVIIVTGDKDLFQLVSKRILVYMPTKGLSEAKLYDTKAVVDRMQVTPKLVPDLKALAGDPSDNYPGVVGIGPKTAVSLLETYKSLQGILKSQKLSKKEKESARLGKELATIHTDVPLDGEVSELRSLNRPEAIDALQQFGFRSIIKRLSGQNKEEHVSQQQELF